MTTDRDGLARTDRILDALGARAPGPLRDGDDLTAALASWARHVDPALAVGRRRRRFGRSVAVGALALATLMGSSVAAAMTESDLGPLTDVGKVVVAWIPDAIEPVLEAESEEPSPQATAAEGLAGEPSGRGERKDPERAGPATAPGDEDGMEPMDRPAVAHTDEDGMEPMDRPAAAHEDEDGVEPKDRPADVRADAREAGAGADAEASGSPAASSVAAHPTPGLPVAATLPPAASDRAREVATPGQPGSAPPASQRPVPASPEPSTPASAPPASAPPASPPLASGSSAPGRPAAPGAGAPGRQGHGHDAAGQRPAGGPPPAGQDQAPPPGSAPARAAHGGGPPSP